MLMDTHENSRGPGISSRGKDSFDLPSLSQRRRQMELHARFCLLPRFLTTHTHTHIHTHRRIQKNQRVLKGSSYIHHAHFSYITQHPSTFPVL